MSDMRGHYVRTPEHRRRQSALKLGDANPNWKGDNLTYRGVHARIVSLLGPAASRPCADCGKTSAVARIEWANISRTYSLDVTDWKPLCKGCHLIFDDVMAKRKKRVCA